MHRLVGRRCPFGTPLPTRPCVTRVTFTQWLSPIITRLTRCYLWRSTSRWIVHDLKRNSWTTRVFSTCLHPGFMSPASRYPRKTCSRRTRFSLVPGWPMGFRGVWVSDSSSPRWDTSEKNLFPASSIFIGSWSTNGVSRCLDTGFVFPAPRYPRKSCFRPARFPLVPGRPIGFEANGPQIRVLRIELPPWPLSLLTLSVLVGDVLLTLTQTNLQTNYFFS